MYYISILVMGRTTCNLINRWTIYDNMHLRCVYNIRDFLFLHKTRTKFVQMKGFSSCFLLRWMHISSNIKSGSDDHYLWSSEHAQHRNTSNTLHDKRVKERGNTQVGRLIYDIPRSDWPVSDYWGVRGVWREMGSCFWHSRSYLWGSTW